jgi:ketosteroid isomerase-like protein
MRVGLILLLCLASAACARQPDEEAVRSTIEAMAASTAEREAADVLDHVSDDFIGNDGAFDRARLAELVRGQLLMRSVSVRLGTVDVEVAADRATAIFDATLTDSSDRWIPSGSTDLRFVTGWRREGDRWLCINARWTQP